MMIFQMVQDSAKMKAAQLLQQSKKELRGISPNPYQESLWIAGDVLNCSSTEIYLKETTLSPKQQKVFWHKIQRRKRQEPLEHILQEKIFLNRRFHIERGVFIPRPETEIMIQWAIQNILKKNLTAVDFGAGAGTLCLSLLSAFPDSRFLALEICKKALSCLRKNSRSFQVEKRLSILQKDVCHLTKKEAVRILGSAPSLIMANPPYIDPGDPGLNREVYLFEPPLALFSDKQGMGHIISWFEKAMELLTPKGLYIFEFGWNQERRMKDFCQKQKALSSYKIHRDQAGRPRMAVCFKK